MISEFLNKCFLKNQDNPFIGTLIPGTEQYKWSTYQEIYTKAQHLASYLSENITNPPDTFGTVCICSESRDDWLISDFACALCGLVSVSFHSSWPLDESITIANDVNASIAIVSESELSYFQKIAEKQKTITTIICMDDVTEPNVVKLKDIYEKPIKPYKVSQNEIYTIIYSSGTTGSPKGLAVTRNRWLLDAHRGPFKEDERNVFLSTSSLAHGMDRGLIWQIIPSCGKVAFSKTEFKGILECAQIVEPSIFMSMPHFWNDLYFEYKKIVNQLILNYLKTKEKVEEPSKQLVALLFSCVQRKDENEIIEKIVKESNEKTSRLIGTKCKIIGTGGSFISDQVLNFLNEVWPDCQVINSYGTTEVPGISNNGVISSNVELKLVDCPECGYVSTDEKKVGEIVVRMPHMVTSYWGKRESSIKATKENFKDGWYYTQDIGRIDNEGKLEIIDRKSDVVELYVDGRSVWIPISPIENIYLNNSKLFTRIYLHGDRAQSYMIAVVVPKNDEKVTRHQIFREIIQTARSKKLESVEIPRAVIVSDHAWTQETGELSSTNKLKRGTILKNFKAMIDSEYARIAANDEENEKLRKDKSFDFINYKFLCDDEENSPILNEMMGEIRQSILNLRDQAIPARKRVEENEEKVVKETNETKEKCFKENDEFFSKISDDDSFNRFLNTVIKNKKLVKDACKRREDARYASDPLIADLDAKVNSQVSKIIEKADEIGERVPYQIRSGLFKLSPAKIQETGGNCLSESMAPSNWEVWCDCCGVLIEVGKYGEGTPRYICLDCDKVYCNKCFEHLSKLMLMSEKHQSWIIPYECFANNHYLSKEFMKFLRIELNPLCNSDSVSKICDEFCSKYENRILIESTDKSKSITYAAACKMIKEKNEGNPIIKLIIDDINKNDKELISNMFKKKINDWPIIVHLNKDDLDSTTIWNTMFNGGRLILD